MAERYEKHKVEQKLADKIQLNDRSAASSSSSDSGMRKKRRRPSSLKFNAFLEGTNLFKGFGGGKPGHYIPQLCQVIVRYNQAMKEPVINLKGFMVGNPLAGDYHDYLGFFQFMWSAGMISDQTFKEANAICGLEPFLKPSEQFNKILDKISEDLGNIDR